jgi:uncharacterized protein (DUF1330 family)
MPAYVIAELEVTDPAAYDKYRKRVPSVISQYAGKFISRAVPQAR